MSRFVLPRESTFNINGAPQDGAKLEFFNPGLLTNKDTYSDQALTTANTNPVIADASGRFSSIWMNGDYDVTLKDKKDVLIWGPERVQSNVTNSDSFKLNEDTAATMAADTAKIYVVGDVVETAEFSTGNGGGGTYKCVTVGTTATVDLPNGYNIIVSTADATKCFVLRVGGVLDLTKIGLTTSNDFGLYLTHALANMTVSKITAPRDTYTQTTGVIETVTRDVVIDLSNSIIDATAITSSAVSSSVIRIGGSEESGSALSSDAGVGDGSIVTSETLAVGDWFYLDSTTLWSEDRSYYTKGEICKVLSVSGTNIGLEWDLFDSYLAATTTVKKLNLPTIEIKPFKMEMGADTTVTGVYIEYSQNASLEDTIISGARGACSRLDFCINSEINNPNHSADYQPGDGLNYGLFLSSCFATHVNGGTLLGGRHGYTTGGTGIPTRNCNANDLTTSADKAAGTAGFDQHSNNEGSRVIGCTMLAGINTNASNSFIDYCDIYNGALDYSIESFIPRNCQYRIFGKNNRIFNNHSSGDAVRVSFVDKDGAVDNVGLRVDNMEIDWSHLDTLNSGVLIQARTTTSDQGFKRLRIGGNYMVNDSSGGKMIELKTDLTDLNIDNVIIDTSSMIHNAADSSVSILSGQGVIGKMKLKPELTKTSTGFGLRVSAVDILCVTDAILSGGSTGSRNDLSGFSILKLSDNIITGWTSTGGILATSSVTGAIIQASNNTGDESFLNNSSITNDYIRFLDIGTRTANRENNSPATGTWKQGDIVWHSQPTAGGTVGWVCTTGGTPGTWKTFGAITA